MVCLAERDPAVGDEADLASGGSVEIQPVRSTERDSSGTDCIGLGSRLASTPRTGALPLAEVSVASADPPLRTRRDGATLPACEDFS
jgi:hypothetical protein